MDHCTNAPTRYNLVSRVFREFWWAINETRCFADGLLLLCRERRQGSLPSSWNISRTNDFFDHVYCRKQIFISAMSFYAEPHIIFIGLAKDALFAEKSRRFWLMEVDNNQPERCDRCLWCSESAIFGFWVHIGRSARRSFKCVAITRWTELCFPMRKDKLLRLNDTSWLEHISAHVHRQMQKCLNVPKTWIVKNLLWMT